MHEASIFSIICIRAMITNKSHVEFHRFQSRWGDLVACLVARHISSQVAFFCLLRSGSHFCNSNLTQFG
jgi:hypothetical protein